jgi:hypothetical protein
VKTLPPEPAAGGGRPASADPPRPTPGGDVALITSLQELVAALDERVPHIERAGEQQIARDATALRTEALNRLAQLRKARD